jgi:hypothetical protein
MKLRAIVCLSLFGVGIGIAAAPDSSDMKPPAVIQINREWLKPGKSGAIHDRSEAAFVNLMNKGKLQGHYVALNSMSGKSRALYMTRYPSFEAWENDNKIFEKNASLAAELDRDISADGEFLEGMDSAVLVYNEGLSYHPRPDFSHARYYELTAFKVRIGHEREFREVTKMYKEACDKAGVALHWGAYELMYGGDSGTYIMLTHRDTLAEIDQERAASKKIMEAMGGEDGAAKMDQTFASAIESVRSELFTINPKQSYVDEATMKADADFWKPKAMAPKGAAKPAPATTAKPASR